MALQRAIIRQGSSLIDKSKVVPLKWFRLAAITEGPDLNLFVNPATLSRLALWLVDALRDRLAVMAAGREGGGREKDRRTRSLPVVVACLDERAGTYVVVGVTGAPEFGDVRKK
jgi:cell division control protein 45